MSSDRKRRDGLAAVGVGALLIVRCAGPVLISAGALAGVGALPRSWWLLGVAALVAVSVVLTIALRRRRGAAEPCCPPEREKRPSLNRARWSGGG